MRAIADSSCLISLAVVEALWLLPHLFSEILIPEAVYEEVVLQGAGRPGAKEVQEAAWIKCVTVTAREIVKELRAQGLGKGEAEVLALAGEGRGDLVLVDDERTWQVAETKGIAYLRSVELLLEAYRRGLLKAGEVEEKVKALGEKRWLSPKVVEEALRQLK